MLVVVYEELGVSRWGSYLEVRGVVLQLGEMKITAGSKVGEDARYDVCKRVVLTCVIRPGGEQVR